jgi:hypothetical protein
MRETPGVASTSRLRLNATVTHCTSLDNLRGRLVHARGTSRARCALRDAGSRQGGCTVVSDQEHHRSWSGRGFLRGLLGFGGCESHRRLAGHGESDHACDNSPMSWDCTAIPISTRIHAAMSAGYGTASSSTRHRIQNLRTFKAVHRVVENQYTANLLGFGTRAARFMAIQNIPATSEADAPSRTA